MEIARPTTEISTLANQSAGLNLITDYTCLVQERHFVASVSWRPRDLWRVGGVEVTIKQVGGPFSGLLFSAGRLCHQE